MRELSITQLRLIEYKLALQGVRLRKLVPILLLAVLASGQSTAPHSSITIHVHKAGLFSAFGHNHTVVAPVAHGAFDTRAMTADVVIESKQLKVTDSDVSEKDRQEVQTTMLGPKVLDSDKYPQIHFASSRIVESSPQHLRISGKLDLHGVTRELSFEMTGGPDHYRGTTRLKQTDFGIQPVSVGGGTVKVQNEIDLDLDIYLSDFTRTQK